MSEAGSPTTTEVWYIEVGREKRGPFSPEQIQELFDNGDVLSDTRIFNQTEPTHYLTVMDLFKSRTDPDSTLFDVLLAVREHRAPAKREGPTARPPSPPRTLILVLSTAISMLLSWGVFQFLKKLNTTTKVASTLSEPVSTRAGNAASSGFSKFTGKLPPATNPFAPPTTNALTTVAQPNRPIAPPPASPARSIAAEPPPPTQTPEATSPPLDQPPDNNNNDDPNHDQPPPEDPPQPGNF
jgi:hypothetical protein